LPDFREQDIRGAGLADRNLNDCHNRIQIERAAEDADKNTGFWIIDWNGKQDAQRLRAFVIFRGN